MRRGVRSAKDHFNTHTVRGVSTIQNGSSEVADVDVVMYFCIL